MLAADTNSSRLVMLHRSISRVVVYFDTIHSPLMRLYFMCLILFKWPYFMTNFDTAADDNPLLYVRSIFYFLAF